MASLALDDRLFHQFTWPVFLGRTTVSVLLLAAWYVNAAALNDYADFAIDKVNLSGDKHRPLVSGLANKSDLLAVAVFSILLAIASAIWLSDLTAWLSVVLLLFNVAYSFKPLQISRRGGVAILCLPFCYTVLPLTLGFLLVDDWRFDTERFWLYAGMYSHFIARIILKDYRDVEGDSLHGKRTFLLRHSSRTVCVLSGIALATNTCIFLVVFDVYLDVFSYPIVFLSAFAARMLVSLSQVDDWLWQKTYLSVFGRTMTGITVSLMLAFISYVWQASVFLQIVLALAVGLIYFVSAREAGLYNLHRLTANTD